MEAERKRRYSTGSGLNKRFDNDNEEPTSTERSIPNVLNNKVRPWRISTDVPRAIMDTVIAGVGYLL